MFVHEYSQLYIQLGKVIHFALKQLSPPFVKSQNCSLIFHNNLSIILISLPTLFLSTAWNKKLHRQMILIQNVIHLLYIYIYIYIYIYYIYIYIYFHIDIQSVSSLLLTVNSLINNYSSIKPIYLLCWYPLCNILHIYHTVTRYTENIYWSIMCLSINQFLSKYYNFFSYVLIFFNNFSQHVHISFSHNCVSLIAFLSDPDHKSASLSLNSYLLHQHTGIKFAFSSHLQKKIFKGWFSNQAKLLLHQFKNRHHTIFLTLLSDI